jgi:hypothetical protein
MSKIPRKLLDRKLTRPITSNSRVSAEGHTSSMYYKAETQLTAQIKNQCFCAGELCYQIEESY